VNVGQLIQRLGAYPADMPVVLEMEYEPCGDYEVATVDGVHMEHDPTWDPMLRVYQSPGDCHSARCDPPRDVVLLGGQARGRAVVDVEPMRPAIGAGGTP